jgi:hypothetical protein
MESLKSASSLMKTWGAYIVYAPLDSD